MIPKIMHQIWLGKKQMPSQFITWRENWRQLHADWDYKLWTEDDVYGKEILSLMNQATTLSCKSNVLRFFVVYKYGGVYTDVDFDWNKNIDEFLKHDTIACKQPDHMYNTAFFGAIQQHPWLKYLCESLDQFVGKDPPWGWQIMTESISRFSNITTLPTDFFYPYIWDEPYKDAKQFPQSYAVHHWYKSWEKEYASFGKS